MDTLNKNLAFGENLVSRFARNKNLFASLQNLVSRGVYTERSECARNKTIKAGVIAIIISFGFLSPWLGLLVEGSPSIIINTSNQETPNIEEQLPSDSSETFLAAINAPSSVQMKKIIVTAYSSTLDQTDSYPFITASGEWVSDGIIAANFLPFGTRVKLPLLFEDKIFIVEDRMHERFADTRIDIWFPERELAEEFGIKETIIEILEQKVINSNL
jgi:3D (Asp-Asp-Asp) domain-containing protein